MRKKTYLIPRVKVMPIADAGIMCASGGESPEPGGDDGDGSKEAEGKYNFKLLD